MPGSYTDTSGTTRIKDFPCWSIRTAPMLPSGCIPDVHVGCTLWYRFTSKINLNVNWFWCHTESMFWIRLIPADVAQIWVSTTQTLGNRNWQIETADWNLDVRLDIWVVKKLYARLEILLRNCLAGSKTVVSISRDATVKQDEAVHDKGSVVARLHSGIRCAHTHAARIHTLSCSTLSTRQHTIELRAAERLGQLPPKTRSKLATQNRRPTSYNMETKFRALEITR